MSFIEKLQNVCQHRGILSAGCCDGNPFTRAEQFGINYCMVDFIFKSSIETFFAQGIPRLGSLEEEIKHKYHDVRGLGPKDAEFLQKPITRAPESHQRATC